MVKFLAALILVLGITGCATAPENKVNIKVTNTTGTPLKFQAGMSIFGTSIIVMPGETWTGWVDRRLIGSSGWLKVSIYDPAQVTSRDRQ